MAKVPVVAPTSVVALSGGQFAVTSLTSTRLVQIIDERGKVIRSFGDPQYITEDEAGKDRVIDWGKITGDSAGGLYFAFTSLPQPTGAEVRPLRLRRLRNCSSRQFLSGSRHGAARSSRGGLELHRSWGCRNGPAAGSAWVHPVTSNSAAAWAWVSTRYLRRAEVMDGGPGSKGRGNPASAAPRTISATIRWPGRFRGSSRRKARNSMSAWAPRRARPAAAGAGGAGAGGSFSDQSTGQGGGRLAVLRWRGIPSRRRRMTPPPSHRSPVRI